MKAVILAGGLGTRISEETNIKPKPMVEIGGMPILWHLMKIYSSHGINDFIICLGYKGYKIKEYFANYSLHNSDLTIDIEQNKIEVHKKNITPWKVTLVDTGVESMTGGRLKRVESYLSNEDDFCFTYGDGLADINIKDLVKFHKSQNKVATITTVQTPGRFGVLKVEDNIAINFLEKPIKDGTLINGGFFVLKKKVLKYIKNDNSIWETDVLPKLAEEKNLAAWVHKGYWQAMDTLREKNILNDLWSSGNAPWKTWK